MWTETMPIHRQGSTTGYSESAIYLDDQINLIAVMVGIEARRCFTSLSQEEARYLESFFKDEFEAVDQWITKHALEPISMRTVHRNRELSVLYQSYKPSQGKLASLKEFISISPHCAVVDDDLCKDSFNRIIAAHIVEVDSKLAGIKRERASQRMSSESRVEFRIVAISNQTWLHLNQKVEGGCNHLSASLISLPQQGCCSIQ
ncbi:hypothetical protein PNK_2398 [Candidatus Protochlamydia naegleriophila]|uniref:Uncharacterized protein n=1 Tax=Candidatus Protochlamydia naegleriophila TaxID=389348 RepID=A0A0U5JDF0_9BACT|nr:hypothetical protein [Candidatus Protochlamydia naegleriophila]CUI17993.1 hypothetical protein PNK_2398 [Candidatus Protochlamydia naegleriophila]